MISHWSAILCQPNTDQDRAEDSDRGLSGTSAGEGQGELSGVPLVQHSSAQRSAMALQEDRLEAIAQRVVARLQASEPQHKQIGKGVGKKSRGKS